MLRVQKLKRPKEKKTKHSGQVVSPPVVDRWKKERTKIQRETENQSFVS